jgi:hypothetical protein
MKGKLMSARMTAVMLLAALVLVSPAWSTDYKQGNTGTPSYSQALEIPGRDNNFGPPDNPDCRSSLSNGKGASCVDLRINVPTGSNVTKVRLGYKDYGKVDWQYCDVAPPEGKPAPWACGAMTYANFRGYFASKMAYRVEFASWATSKRDAKLEVWFHPPGKK